MSRAFLDTNILVYAADRKSPSPRKTIIARELLNYEDLYISVQVLNEFTVNAKRVDKLNLSDGLFYKWIQFFFQFPIKALSSETYLKALTLQSRYQISHWDSLIISSATESFCQVLYTEDLNHGQIYDGVKCVNPFLGNSGLMPP